MVSTEMSSLVESGCPYMDGLAVAPARRGTSLLLAPLDSDADKALASVLHRGGYSCKRRGELLFLPEPETRLAALRGTLNGFLPKALHSRVKAALLGFENGPKTLRAALLSAEPLPRFFEREEVAWVRDALKDDWLFSVYHPILNAQTGDHFAYEALIRARHPITNEILSAGRLIDGCTRLNLQHQLDLQARLSAIRGAAELNRPGERFFINFLPAAVYDPAKSLQITLEAAAEVGIQTKQLVFEVVETEEIEDPASLRKLLDFYREKGVGIALDDIGSGFSSLQHLTDLQPDYVKIDRHICASAATISAARHTLTSIVGLARKIGSKVVAEGIETEKQMAVCVNAGVDFLQGFLFAQPAAPPEAVAAHYFHKADCTPPGSPRI